MPDSPAPVRIQRKRTKGWRMPENTICVCRPGPWGNPFIVSEKITPGKHVGGVSFWAVPCAEDAVECFREMLQHPARAEYVLAIREQLKGRNLACWCPLDAPCHADVLLELANAP